MSASINPFPGLRPFRRDEHHLFFGREEQTAELLGLLRQHRFLAVVGTSGSGKSSLVQAGLIPALHRGSMTRAGSSWEVVVLRPGGQPIENLARALVEADLYDAEDPDTLPRLGATLNRSRFGLVEAIRQSDDIEPDTNLLVVVDQFEELFRFRKSGVDSEEAAAAFVNLLFAASEQEEQRIYIALTMRSDYLGDCSEIPELAEAVNRGEYLIPRLMRDQKREAIEMPVGVGGAKISPRLVQRMLNEIGDDPDQLPVLQHALMRTWEVWSRRENGGAEIDFGDFEATGGLAEALSRHADEIYNELPDDAHRQTCARLYRALTVKGSDNRGIRRPTQLADLEAIARADRSMVTAILDAYRRPGVTFLMPGIDRELNEETVIDLSHESLMRCWRRLDHWVEDESQSARIYQRLRETAALHAEGKAGLYHDPDLQIAQSWREDSRPDLAWAEQYGGRFEPTVEFLDESEDKARQAEREAEEARQRELLQAKDLAEKSEKLAETQRRAARGFRRFALGMGVVALMALAAFAFALSQKEQAESDRQSAEQSEVSALNAEAGARWRRYMSDMSLVQQAIGQSNIGRARRLLDAHLPEPGNPDIRGWEWRYLDAQTLSDESARLGPFDRRIYSIDYSQDGRWLAVAEGGGAEGGGQFSLWDIETKQVIYRRKVASRLLAFSPTENLLVVAEDSSSLLLLRVDNEAQISESWINVGGRVGHPVFSPNGRQMALFVHRGQGSSEVQVRDVEESTELFPAIATSKVESNPHIRRVAMSDKILAIGDSDGSVRVHSSSSGEHLFDCEHPEAISAVAISPNGKLLATGTGTAESDIRLWDLNTGKLLHTLKDHLNWVCWLEFFRDGNSLASVSADQTVRIWDVQEGKETRVIRGNQDEVQALALSPDGATLASGSKGKWVRFFDLNELDSRPSYREHDNWHASDWFERRMGTSKISFSPRDDFLATLDGQGRPMLVDTNKTLEKIRDLPALGSNCSGVLFYPDGSRLLATRRDGELMVYDLASDRILQRKETGYSHFYPRSITQNGLLATTGGTVGRKIVLWNAETLEEIDEYPRPEWGARSLSSQGKFAAPQRGKVGPVIGLRDATAGPLKDQKARVLLPSGGGFSDISFSDDDRFMVASDWGGFVNIWDLHSREETPQRFKAQMMATYRAVFFQSSERLVTLGNAGDLVKIWDRRSGQELLSFTGNGAGLEVKVSPDGQTIAVASGFRKKERLQLWRAPSYAEIEAARKATAESVYPVETSESLAIAEQFAASIEAGSYDEVRKQWNEIVTLDPWPKDLPPRKLMDGYVLAVGAEAKRLHAGGQEEEAIALLRPIALYHSINSPLRSHTHGQLIEWQSDSVSLVEESATWKFLDDGSDQETAWRDPDFDDGAWKEGPAQLGYDNNPRTEIDPGPDADRHITSYFRRRFTIPHDRKVKGLRVEVLRDDGIVLYLNGEEILRDNMPEGPITAESVASQRVSEDDEIRIFSFVVPAPALRQGVNVLAAEIHQVNATSSDLGFDLRVTALSESPASFLEKLLAGEEGVKLAESVRDLLPEPMREEWMSDVAKWRKNFEKGEQ